jgi:hypothetical protein
VDDVAAEALAGVESDEEELEGADSALDAHGGSVPVVRVPGLIRAG